MIRLQEGLNTVVCTLTEKSILDQTETIYYIIEFESTQTRKKYHALLIDISAYRTRYNKFELTVLASGSALPLDSEVRFFEGGEFIYRIYEQTSATNLDPDSADNLVETGMMTYDLTFVANDTHTPDELTTKAYEPNI